jgi:hypothetical protein
MFQKNFARNSVTVLISTVSFNGVVSSGGAAFLAPQRHDPEDSRQQQRRWWRIRFQN